jgi:hypothetical protein
MPQFLSFRQITKDLTDNASFWSLEGSLNAGSGALDIWPAIRGSCLDPYSKAFGLVNSKSEGLRFADSSRITATEKVNIR